MGIHTTPFAYTEWGEQLLACIQYIFKMEAIAAWCVLVTGIWHSFCHDQVGKLCVSSQIPFVPLQIRTQLCKGRVKQEWKVWMFECGLYQSTYARSIREHVRGISSRILSIISRQ